MSIKRTKYRTYSTSMLKVRSSVPDQNTITESGNDILCTDINLRRVRQVLGVTTHNLREMCNHASLNRWSAFGPVVRSTTGSNYAKELVNSIKTNNLNLNYFTGYNHSAVTPGWQTGGKAAAEANNWVNSGSQATCNANIDIGEIDWGTDFAAVGVAMLIFDEADQIAGWGYQALSSVGSNFTLSGTSTILGGIVLDKTWYGMAFIVNQTITNPEDVISAVVCRVPNISTWAINLKVKAASDWRYDGDAQSIPSPWVQNGGAGMNWNTGYFDIGNITCNQNFSNVHIYASLFDWTDALIGTGDIYNDIFYSMSDITGSVYLGMTSIPAYGYYVIVYISQS